MPKPVKPEEQEVEPVVEPVEKSKPEAAPVEVDLNEVEEVEEESAEERARNKKFAQMRVENKALHDKLADLENRLNQKQTVATPAEKPYDGYPQTEEDWDKLAAADWKKAVDLRSVMNAKRLMEETNAQNTYTSKLEEAKRSVLAKHPELNESNSEKSKVFLQVLEENPEYKSLARGPILAMRDMEEKLGLSGSTKSDRADRVALSSSGGKVSTSSDAGKVVLTADEVEFCKFNNIDPKEYAKNKKRMHG